MAELGFPTREQMLKKMERMFESPRLDLGPGAPDVMLHLLFVAYCCPLRHMEILLGTDPSLREAVRVAARHSLPNIGEKEG